MFNERCDDLITESVSALKKEYTNSKYFSLQDAMMAKICSFNRRRVGETQRFLLDDYQKKTVVERDSDFYNSLTIKEKSNSEELLHFFIRGKRGKKPVPIMLSLEDAKIIDTVIIPHRGEANIYNSNIYLFAKRKDSLNCCDSIRTIAYACGAKYPAHITGTKLRKHLATTTGTLNLSESQKDMV